MKKHLSILNFLLGLLLLSACGPTPKTAKAPNNPFLPEGHSSGTLELQGKYESSSAVFAMFFEPTLEELKEEFNLNSDDEAKAKLTEIGKTVGIYSPRLDNVYLEYTNKRNELLKKKQEWKERTETYKAEEKAILKEKLLKMDEEKAKEVQAALIGYKCYTNNTKNVCLLTSAAGETSIEMIPQACPDLRQKDPWRKLHSKKMPECNAKIKKLDDKYIQEKKTTEDQLVQIEKEFLEDEGVKEQYLKTKELDNSYKEMEINMNQLITDQTGPITTSVDFDRASPDTYRNWIPDTKQNQIIESDGKIEIKLLLQINNLEQNELNQPLYYTSTGENPDIFDIRNFLEYGTPTLSFKFYEKQYIPDSNEEVKEIVLKDHFFEVKLRRNYTSYGIIYQGEFFKKNQEGIVLRRGMMKMMKEIAKSPEQKAYEDQLIKMPL